MNRSEKLLEAIGQIDDRLVLDAQKAGTAPGTKAAAGSSRDAHKAKKKNGRKKVTAFRYRNVLAVCAALVICIGVYRLLAMQGLILSPFDGQKNQILESTDSVVKAPAEEMPEMAAAVPEEAAAEEKAAAAVPEEALAAVPEEAPAAASEETSDGAAVASEEEPKEHEKQETTMVQGSDASKETDGGTITAEQTEEGDNTADQVQSASEPRTMCLLPEAEAVSDNELSLMQSRMAAFLNITVARITGKEITLHLSNTDTELTVSYGAVYGLERQTQDGWTAVSQKENVAWVDIRYELEPGRSLTETLPLEDIFGSLETGHYRLVKNGTVTAADQTEREFTVYTEFDLTN